MKVGKLAKALRPEVNDFKVDLVRKDSGFEWADYDIIALNWWHRKVRVLKGFFFFF